jgi:hypothetical protein
LSSRNLSDSRNRLEAARREREDLRGSAETYRELAARGAFLPEQRIDLIETLAALKVRHRLVALDYQVAPQRALKFGTGANYASADIRASRIFLKAQAIHDADLIGFLDEFPRISRGFFPIDRCVFKRLEAGSGTAPVAAPAAVDDDEQPLPRPAAAPLQASIEASCTLEWVTLVDKAGLATPGGKT